MFIEALEHKIESSTTHTVGVDYTIEELLEVLNMDLQEDKS